MPDFFEKRDPWGQGLALWVLLGMAFVLPLALWGITRVELKNDVEHWLSDDNIQTRQFKWYQKYFHNEDGLLLTWEGSHLDDPRIEQFASRLEGTVGADGIRRGGLKQIKSVRTPGQLLEKMTRYGIAPEEAMRRVQGVLSGPGKIRVQLTSAGLEQQLTVARLLTEGAMREFGLAIKLEEPFPLAEGVSSTAPVDNAEAVPATEGQIVQQPGETAQTDPLAFVNLPVCGPHDLQISWRYMHVGQGDIQQFQDWAKTLRAPIVGGDAEGALLIEQCFNYADSPAALAIYLSEAGVADCGGTLAAIRRVAGEVGIDETKIHMGGTPVSAAELHREVIKSVWNAEAPIWMLHGRSVIALSGLVGILLAFWLLRSVRLATIVLAVSYYTTIVTTAIVPWTGGSMNMVLVVMPTLLLVVTISGAVHMANYWKHEAHRDRSTAIVKAIQMAREPCILASVTTAIGLGSLMTSKLAPVRDFGLYSAIGTLISLVAVLYAVPALLQIWQGTPPPEREVDRRPWTLLGRWLVRYPTVVTASCLIVCAICTFGLRWFRTETKVIRYFAEKSRVVQDYNYLEENLAGIVPVEMVISFGKDAQSELNFLDRMEVVRAIEEKVRQLPDISGTLSLADFQPVSVKPAENAGFRDKVQRNARSKAVEEKVKHDAQAAKLLVVPGDTSEFHQAGDELWRVTAQVAIMSNLNYAELTTQLDQICQSETRYHAASRHLVTGMVPLFLATQKAVLDSLIVSFGMAFAMISIMMMLLLRHPVAGLLSMLPNLVPIGSVFGLIAWSGISVDIGTMITASIGLGIAVDGTLHLLTWFRNGIINGETREDAIVIALEHCGPAMWQTSLAVGIGLMMLCPADLLLINRFGWLMGSLIAGALFADVILTPAMLAGPMGAMIERAFRPAKLVEAAQPLENVDAASALPAPHMTSVNSTLAGHPPANSDRRIDIGS